MHDRTQIRTSANQRPRLDGVGASKHLCLYGGRFKFHTDDSKPAFCLLLADHDHCVLERRQIASANRRAQEDQSVRAICTAQEGKGQECERLALTAH